jgi:signal transduction histidine kinase
MGRATEPTDLPSAGESGHFAGPDRSVPCPLHGGLPPSGTLTNEPGGSLNNRGCPPPDPPDDRQSFETLLAGLSATFVNLPADAVDAEIESALRQIVEYLGVDRSSLAEVSADQAQIVITHAYEAPGAPPSPRVILEERFPHYAKMIYRGEVFRVPDDLPAEATSEREYCARSGLRSNLTIPLKVGGTVVAAYGVASFRARIDWPDQLVRRLYLLGQVLTNALARKRADEALRARQKSVHQAREALHELAGKLLHAQEEERRRVAREMHDDWTQRLAALSIDCVKIEQLIGPRARGLDLLHSVQADLIRLSEDVHDLSRQLHPSILDDLGLVEALRSECAGFSRREGIAVDYRPEDVPASLPRDVALCVYRVAQEALRNVAKHAGARVALVTLARTGPDLVLRVRDEGRGFDPSSAHCRAGLGLSGMQERARLIGADLSITSSPGGGTAVELRVPRSRSDDDQAARDPG